MLRPIFIGANMKKKKKQRGIRTVIAALVIALIAVAALIIWKQWEYSASEDFYNGLRGALRLGGVCA